MTRLGMVGMSIVTAMVVGCAAKQQPEPPPLQDCARGAAGGQLNRHRQRRRRFLRRSRLKFARRSKSTTTKANGRATGREAMCSIRMAKVRSR